MIPRSIDSVSVTQKSQSRGLRLRGRKMMHIKEIGSISSSACDNMQGRKKCRLSPKSEVPPSSVLECMLIVFTISEKANIVPLYIFPIPIPYLFLCSIPQPRRGSQNQDFASKLTTTQRSSHIMHSSRASLLPKERFAIESE